MTFVEKMSVYMPAELKARLRAAAQREGRAEAELIREAAEGYLARAEGDVQPASWGRFASKRAGAATRDEANLGKAFGTYVRRHRTAGKS